MKRRLSLACALVTMPELLLMDEPFLGIDPVSQKIMIDLIREYKKEHSTSVMTTHDLWNSIYYVIAIFLSSFMPSNFLMESILSDKRNQTFERYFVSGNIKTIMFAKLSDMSILGIIPFIVFYTYFLFNGVNIIDNIFMAINTPLYFWISLCIMTIVNFLFNDERSIAFAGVPFLILLAGLLYFNDFLAVRLYPEVTLIVTVVCAVVVTFIAYTFYKKTKYFLKI
jgi:hypothetical protein